MALTVQWVGNPSVPGIIFKIDGGRTADGRTNREAEGREKAISLTHSPYRTHDIRFLATREIDGVQQSSFMWSRFPKEIGSSWRSNH